MLKNLISLVVMVSLLAGCSASAPVLMVNTSLIAQKTADKYEKDGTLKLPDDEDLEIYAVQDEATASIDRSAKPDEKPEDKIDAGNEAAKEADLNYNALRKLDNKSHSWWIKLNSEHKTPEIPAYGRKITDDYDCIYIGDTAKREVYLTFDEGYENGYTSSILDTLKRNDVKALFFITGPYLDKNSKLVRRMLDEGHQVGNHTVNHPSLPILDEKSLKNELYGLEKKMRDTFGVGFKYMRPPKGEYSERTVAAAAQLGYRTVFWSFAYLDYDVSSQKGPDHAYNKVMDNLHNGAVILLHAVSSDNAEALDRIIKGIKAEGYDIKSFHL